MASLYRKWRPQTFAEVSGQEHIKKTIKQAFLKDKTTHAYLFAGPRGTGKTTMARLVAKTFNCEARLGKKQLGFDEKGEKKPQKWDGEPCNQCSSCMEITSGESLDVIEIDAASNRGIEEIRELRDKVKFAPVKSHYKVFIIDEVHMLTKEAFNALLKTLEEPPKHAVFILATTESHKVPATIISRCQRYDFKRAQSNDLVKRLQEVAKGEGITAGEEVFNLISGLAEGSFRDGLSLLDQVISVAGEGKLEAEDVREILGVIGSDKILGFFKILENGNQAISYIEKMVQEGVDFGHYIDALIDGTRKLLLIKSKVDRKFVGADVVDDEYVKWVEVADGIASNEILDLMDKLIVARGEVKLAPFAHLPLEMATARYLQELGKLGGREKIVTKVEVLEETEHKEIKPVVVQDLKKADEEIEPVMVDGVTSVEEKREVLELEKAVWEKILDSLKSKNHSLHMIMKDAIPMSLESDKVVVKVRFKFHSQRIYDLKNRGVIEGICEAVIGRPIRIECQIDNDLPKPERVAEDELVEAAVETFGAE